MKNKNLGSSIKQKRIEKNISTPEIAKNLTVFEAEHIRYENGDMSIFIDNLFVIAEILDTDVNYLLNIYEKNRSLY